MQLLETITFLLIFGIGCILIRKIGQKTVWFTLTASALAKGLLDFLRDVHETQAVSINQILCATVLFLTLMIACLLKIGGNKI